MIVGHNYQPRIVWPTGPALWIALIAAGGLIGTSLALFSTVKVALVVLAAAAAGLIFLWPEVGTLLGVFALYSNITVLAFRLHGAPRAFAFSFLVLFGLPLIYYVFYKRHKVIVDRTFRLMIVFLLAVLASTAFSKDPARAFDWITIFLTQGMVTYFLVVNVVRNRATFERVVTVLLCTGALLGGLSLYQEISNDYGRQFLGLAQRNLRHVEDPSEFSVTSLEHVRLSHRAGGPFQEANYFAQILIVLLPFAWFRLQSRRGFWRLTAALLAFLILAGLFLTYSRGGFLALMVIGLLAIRWKLLRLRTVTVGVMAGVLFLSLAAPGYFNRIGSLAALSGLISERSEVQPDGAISGRATEMLAAISVFLDHPLLGVGPAHYSPYYSVAYQTSASTAFRLIERTRRAHSLYFETAAELGLTGLTVFLVMVGMTFLTLARLRRLFLFDEPYMSGLLAAGVLSLTGLLTTALFLQLSYQRYFWFFLALAAALERIARVERRELYTEYLKTDPDTDEIPPSPVGISPGEAREPCLLPGRG